MAAIVCCLLGLSSHIRGAESALLQTQEFGQPPMGCRPIPLWFWNNTQINRANVVQQVGKMIETDGYGGFAILPFGANFRPGYLSEEYFALYGAAIEKARSL